MHKHGDWKYRSWICAFSVILSIGSKQQGHGTKLANLYLSKIKKTISFSIHVKRVQHYEIKLYLGLGPFKCYLQNCKNWMSCAVFCAINKFPASFRNSKVIRKYRVSSSSKITLLPSSYTMYTNKPYVQIYFIYYMQIISSCLETSIYLDYKVYIQQSPEA